VTGVWSGEPSRPRNAANKSNDNVGNFKIYHNREPKGPAKGMHCERDIYGVVSTLPTPQDARRISVENAPGRC